MQQPQHTKKGIIFKNPFVFQPLRARLLCLVHYETPCTSFIILEETEKKNRFITEIRRCSSLRSKQNKQKKRLIMKNVPC